MIREALSSLQVFRMSLLYRLGWLSTGGGGGIDIRVD